MEKNMSENKLLEVLNSFNSTSEYKIVSTADIQKSLDSVQIQDIESWLESLENNGFVDVKFFDDQNICYKILKFFHDTVTPIDENPIELKVKNKKNYFIFFIVGVCAFCGAFLGNLIFYLLPLA